MSLFFPKRPSVKIDRPDFRLKKPGRMTAEERRRRAAEEQKELEDRQFQEALAGHNDMLNGLMAAVEARGYVMKYMDAPYDPSTEFPDDGFAWSIAPVGITSPRGYSLEDVREFLDAPDPDRYVYDSGGHPRMEWLVRMTAEGY